MTHAETIESLRCCFGFGVCSDCKAKSMNEEDKLPCKLDCKDRLWLYAADLIERLAAENAALREKRRWQPVSTGNPERKGCYLVTVHHWLDGAPVAREAFWNGVDWLSCERRHEITPRVTHWVPLPDGAEVNDGKENS